MFYSKTVRLCVCLSGDSYLP